MTGSSQNSHSREGRQTDAQHAKHLSVAGSRRRTVHLLRVWDRLTRRHSSGTEPVGVCQDCNQNIPWKDGSSSRYCTNKTQLVVCGKAEVVQPGWGTGGGGRRSWAGQWAEPLGRQVSTGANPPRAPGRGAMHSVP